MHQKANINLWTVKISSFASISYLLLFLLIFIYWRPLSCQGKKIETDFIETDKKQTIRKFLSDKEDMSNFMIFRFIKEKWSFIVPKKLEIIHLKVIKKVRLTFSKPKKKRGTKLEWSKGFFWNKRECKIFRQSFVKESEREINAFSEIKTFSLRKFFCA